VRRGADFDEAIRRGYAGTRVSCHLGHVPTALARSALLSSALLALVPSCRDKPSGSPSSPARAAEPAASAASPPAQPHALSLPKEASVAFAIYSTHPLPELQALASAAAVARLITADLCGDAASCAKVRAFVAGSGFEVAALGAADAPPLPTGAAREVATKRLSPAERDSLDARRSVFTIRAHGEATADELPVRAAYAAATAVASKIDGLLFDPDTFELEGLARFTRHVITVPLGSSVFHVDHIVVHAFREADGTARLVSLGMSRFGLPDLDVKAAPFSLAEPLGMLLNAVASALVQGKRQAPLAISLEEVAKLAGAHAGDLHSGSRPSVPASIDLREVPREQGDSDNLLLRLVPSGGATATGYEALVDGLFGAGDDVVTTPEHDAELLAASQRAKAALPAALARFKARTDVGALLYVKLPFPIPDNDGSNEWMWVEVTTWDDAAIEGTLANEPERIPGLKAGDHVKGKRSDVFDYRLRSSDGGVEGGETTEIMSRR